MCVWEGVWSEDQQWSNHVIWAKYNDLFPPSSHLKWWWKVRGVFPKIFRSRIVYTNLLSMTDDLMGFCWENQFETVKDFFLYDPARGAERLVRGASLQPLRVWTPPVGGWNDIFLLTFCLLLLREMLDMMIEFIRIHSRVGLEFGLWFTHFGNFFTWRVLPTICVAIKWTREGFNAESWWFMIHKGAHYMMFFFFFSGGHLLK